MVGPSQVGKSAILIQYLNSRFNTQYLKTIEDYYNVKVKVQELLFEIDILDTGGSDEF